MAPTTPPAPALSMGTVAVLHAVASGHAFGFDIIDATGLTSGTVYPALERLEELGLLRSQWEDENEARKQGRPPRRYFAVTAPGARALAAALKRYKVFRPVRLGYES
jgi:PadR family transcriptional regulator, regulatory protein PadR